MRAIAVLAVLVYHVWPGVLPGGYIGVDVFFVISGYLITGLLVREFERSDTISLRDFYARRIRRLLPAASVTLLAVAVSAWLWLSASEWRDLSRELVASALYVENWLLVQRSVDYLAQDAAPSPVQHFWSLSVEEQFYIIWPLLMLGVGVLARRRGWPIRQAFLTALGVVTLASLAYGVHVSFVDPAPGYFLTTTRVWELGIGGLLVIAGRDVDGVTGWIRSGFGWLGVAAIGTSAWFYSSRLPFPGYEALLPTLGAAALLFARVGEQEVLGRLLSTRPMQYVGDISYSLYLWHWPVVVFYAPVTGREVATLQDGVVVVVVSILLAHVSKYVIEERFRHARKGESFRPYVIGAGLTATLALFATGLTFAGDQRARAEFEESSLVDNKHPGAGAILNLDWNTNADFIPKAEIARLDRGPAYGLDGSSRCIGSVPSKDLSFCHYGPEDAKLNIVIVGDSHAVHWLPALEKIAGIRGWRVTGITKSSCAFTAALTQFSSRGADRDYIECQIWGQKVVEWILEHHPDLVIISHSPRQAIPGTSYPSSQEAIAEGVRKYARELDRAGIRVAVIKHTPWQLEDVPGCMARPNASIDACSTTAQQALSTASLAIVAKKEASIRVIDMQNYFCFKGDCPVVIGGVLVYRDKHHLTATYARSMAPMLADGIESAMR
ncbi:acyltransferase family protein [Pseudoxanthomonas putridarboris]|uniref:Acyltransferase family protein n=2 Tax=Pseudoxanthomonas putridarboris TaxID=752605 RepID=A0ABU9IW59_9GAMM